MPKHIVLMHGRAVKPAKSAMEEVAKRALIRGIERAGADTTRIESGAVRFSFVYFGDINNDIEAAHSARTAKLLTARNDSEYGRAPCLPIDEIEGAFRRTDAILRFTRAAYRKVLDEADDWRLLDEAADVASLFGRLLTFGLLNSAVVRASESDMTAYLTSQVIGSKIRSRLQAVLQPALMEGDDICLVTHSLGCMVAYDLFWKYSFQSEYETLRARNRRVTRWITIGCPLGEPGVQRNLLDGWAREEERYPRNQILDWINIAAEDDFIAHVASMRAAFGRMRNKASGDVRTIRDRTIFNCWSYTDALSGHLVSNPHDLYGYLMHQDTGAAVAEWL